jgi:hypothetical protein
MKKPTKKQIENDLNHLRHLETCIFPVLVSFMFASVTLSNVFSDIYDLKNFFELMSIFTLLFTIYHLYCIALRNVEKRINVFMWEIGFFLFIVVVYPSAIFSRIFVENLGLKLASNEGFLISFGTYFLITIAGVLISIELILKKVIPAFKNNIFPVLLQKNEIINPFDKDAIKRL